MASEIVGMPSKPEQSTTNVGYGAYPISDPVSCGENLADTARRAIEIAPTLCQGCADYHATFSLWRLSGPLGGVEADRPELIETIGGLLAERIRDKRGPINVVVAAAADTGILATCAHAAWAYAKHELPRISFTVIDRCATPLALCREYGVRHAIAVSTACLDLVTTREMFPADIIVTHSLFRRLTSEARRKIHSDFANWLAPGGYIVSSERLRPPDQRQIETTWYEETHEKVRGILDTPEFADIAATRVAHDRLARLMQGFRKRQHEFDSPAEVRALFTDGGLPLRSLQTIRRATPLADGTSYVAQRMIAVLAAPSGDRS